MVNKHRVGFIGLGAMGLGMAIHLVQDGFPVCGFDLNPMAIERLIAMGGTAATSPKECANEAEFIICMVSNAKQVEDVFFNKSNGAILGLSNNATVILCSTVAPMFPSALLKRVQDDFSKPNVQLIDCPVSGGTVRAAKGSLTILASGASDPLDSAGPLLTSMSENTYIIEGGLGAASKLKLVNQHLAGIHIAVAAEVMGLAATVGLNTKNFYQEVLNSEATSWMFENRVPHMLSDDWTPHSALNIFVKDMGIVACEGIRQSFPLYLASAAEQAYLFGAKQGLGQEDDAGLVRLFLADDPHLVARAADREVDHSNDKNMIPTLVQFLNIVHTLAAVEALALGQKLGLFIKSLSSIIGTAAGSSESFKRVSSDVLECDFTSGPMIAQMRDHMQDTIQIAQGHKYPLQMATATFQLLQSAVLRGLSNEGSPALLRIWSS